MKNKIMIHANYFECVLLRKNNWGKQQCIIQFIQNIKASKNFLSLHVCVHELKTLEAVLSYALIFQLFYNNSNKHRKETRTPGTADCKRHPVIKILQKMLMSQILSCVRKNDKERNSQYTGDSSLSNPRLVFPCQ